MGGLGEELVVTTIFRVKYGKYEERKMLQRKWKLPLRPTAAANVGSKIRTKHRFP